VAYGLYPIQLGVQLTQQLRTPGGDPPRANRLPMWIKAILGAQALVLIPLGLLMFIAPGSAERFFPWDLSDLTSRVLAAWTLAFGGIDTPLEYEALSAIGALLGHGGVVAFDDTVDMLEMARYAMEFCAHESCGKCTPCRIGSVRGAEALAAIGRGEDRDRQLVLVEELCDTMLNASLCGLGGMTPFPVQSAMKHFPEDFRARTRGG